MKRWLLVFSIVGLATAQEQLLRRGPKVHSAKDGTTKQHKMEPHISETELNGVDLGVAQTMDTAHADEYHAGLAQARKYTKHFSHCRNKHTLCASWALQGECQANPRFMFQNCGPMCQSCHFDEPKNTDP